MIAWVMACLTMRKQYLPPNLAGSEIFNPPPHSNIHRCQLNSNPRDFPIRQVSLIINWYPNQPQTFWRWVHCLYKHTTTPGVAFHTCKDRSPEISLSELDKILPMGQRFLAILHWSYQTPNFIVAPKRFYIWNSVWV